MQRTARAASTPEPEPLPVPAAEPLPAPAAAHDPFPVGSPEPLPAAEIAVLLDGVPRQRGPVALSIPLPRTTRPALRLRPWRLLPSPTGTPATFAYTVILALTSLFASYASPGLLHSVYQDSSTDVAHLLRTPAFVLLASALWIAGGLLSPYALAFVLVLTALERRIGGARAILVFLTGHVLATLATEVPVGLAVLVGHLPGTSLHRLDYGISFGVAASIGALSGLLAPWLRWPLLALVGYSLLTDLVAFEDPMTNWGHLISLGIGMGLWPAVRRWYRERGPAAGAVTA
ncbi:rhomboid-like protein [Streptomyces sp. NPDC090088]|uniref:rhomboid-like protein n=1 Tax=Streptomyces sp. NPDC090088 TaxID=3365944 RepID=UPI0038100DD1